MLFSRKLILKFKLLCSLAERLNFERYFFFYYCYIPSKRRYSLDFRMLERQLADYTRLVRTVNLFLFVGTLSLVSSMGPELFTVIIKH